jgi:hypothetical protein
LLLKQNGSFNIGADNMCHQTITAICATTTGGTLQFLEGVE